MEIGQFLHHEVARVLRLRDNCKHTDQRVRAGHEISRFDVEFDDDALPDTEDRFWDVNAPRPPEPPEGYG